MVNFRHLPRSRLLLVLQSLARCRWDEGHVCCDRRDSAGLVADDYPGNVHLGEAGTNVDRTKEFHGEVLNLSWVK